MIESADAPSRPAAPVAVVPWAEVTPGATLAVLSKREAGDLVAHSQGNLAPLLRRCALAVLSSGLELDDARDRLRLFDRFELELEQEARGIRMVLHNAPAAAFVGTRMITGVQEHLFSVLRDLSYIDHEFSEGGHADLLSGAGITDVVFRILRHAGVIRTDLKRPLTVCWGGHAISRAEYDYTKAVGYELGLRGLDVCTGCGPGAMKGPMKGATIAHAKQRVTDGRYIGITEPGIIAAEAPNPIVNQLVIMPDIEKRLEAFVRVAHGLIVFPGGAGTAEELLYLLGLLADPRNAGQILPLVLTGPDGSSAWFEVFDDFVRNVLGSESAARYTIIVDDPAAVAETLDQGARDALAARHSAADAANFNWQFAVAQSYQTPFPATHGAMAELDLRRELPVHDLACNLRRAFSGIVSGNVKEAGIQAVETHGPFQLTGDGDLMAALDELLRQFVSQGRMRLSREQYEPCYEIRR